MSKGADVTETTNKKTDEHWMRHALQLAERAATIGEVPVGAVVVLNDQVIGEGFNQPISGSDPTAHAEIVALRQAAKAVGNYRLPGASLYVTIEPCTMCAGAMIHTRIERVIYGATEPKAGMVESNPNVFQQPCYNHVVKAEGGVLAEESSSLITAFFQHRRQEKKK
jgi:tRNA(adenine34) deaminase